MPPQLVPLRRVSWVEVADCLCELAVLNGCVVCVCLSGTDARAALAAWVGVEEGVAPDLPNTPATGTLSEVQKQMIRHSNNSQERICT